MLRRTPNAGLILALALTVAGCGGEPVEIGGPVPTGADTGAGPTGAPDAEGLPRPVGATTDEPRPQDCDGPDDDRQGLVEQAFTGTATAIDDDDPEWVTFDVERWFTQDLGVRTGVYAPEWEGSVGQDWIVSATRFVDAGTPTGVLLTCESEPRSDAAVLSFEERYGGSVTPGRTEAEQPADPDLLAQIDQAEEQWSATHPSSYTATLAGSEGFASLTQDCGDGPVRIVVEDDRVVQARDTRQNCDLDPDDAPTIEGLYDRARRAAGAVQGEPLFDAEYGYPREFYASDRSIEVVLGVTDLIEGAAPLANDPAGALAEARARWEAAAIADYRLTVDLRCFCPETGPVTAEVVDGASTSERVPTIEDLFDAIAETLVTGDADVSYDDDLGHPITMDLDPIINGVDDERSFTITDLTPTSDG